MTVLKRSGASSLVTIAGIIVEDAGGDVLERIYVSDVVMVTASTIGLEAMLLEKPVIVCVDPNAPELVEYSAFGAAVRVTNAEELRTALEQTLSGGGIASPIRERQRSFIDVNVANLRDADPLTRLKDFLFET